MFLYKLCACVLLLTVSSYFYSNLFFLHNYFLTMAMASCARVPYICMVRADQLRKDEDEQLKEEIKEVIAEIKEEVFEIKEEVFEEDVVEEDVVEEDVVEEEMVDDEEGVVIDLMFESAVLKARVMEL